jgi:hypothetical protein
MPYSETRHLYQEYVILNAFQTEPYGSNVTVFNITFRETGTRSTEYDFNINTILMKYLTYSLFIINLEINIFYTLPSNYTSLSTLLFIGV